MDTSRHFIQIRVTGILIENSEILLVKQLMDSGRNWSLPGGRVDSGEMLQQALVREMKEETGLTINIDRLLYICDYPSAEPSILHISFLVEKLGGKIQLPSNEFDENPIYDVRMVPIHRLTEYGFSDTFRELVQNGFPNAGSYKGLKNSIGL